MPPAIPTNTALDANARILYVGVLTPTVAALSSSSRMAISPIPNLLRLIHHEQAHQRVVEGPELVVDAPGRERQGDAASAVRELVPVRGEELHEEEERD